MPNRKSGAGTASGSGEEWLCGKAKGFASGRGSAYNTGYGSVNSEGYGDCTGQGRGCSAIGFFNYSDVGSGSAFGIGNLDFSGNG